MANEYLDSAKEWWGYVPRRLWDMVTLILTLIPMVAGIVGLVVWGRKTEPPLPMWTIWAVVIAWLSSLVLGYLAFHKVRLERDKALSIIPNSEYVDKKIVDSKIPKVLEVTGTLQKMADYQNVVLNEKLLTKKIRIKTLAKIQDAMRKKLNINSNPKFAKVGNAVKIDLIDKQMKKLGLYNKEFKEGLVPIKFKLRNKGRKCRVEAAAITKQVR